MRDDRGRIHITWAAWRTQAQHVGESSVHAAPMERRKEGREFSHRQQELAEQGRAGKPTLNHLHCWAHGNAEVGPDGRTEAGPCLLRQELLPADPGGAGGAADTSLGGLVRQETEGTFHFSAGVADAPVGISPAILPTLVSEIILSRL